MHQGRDIGFVSIPNQYWSSRRQHRRFRDGFLIVLLVAATALDESLPLGNFSDATGPFN
jgi:hypothetical protein